MVCFVIRYLFNLILVFAKKSLVLKCTLLGPTIQIDIIDAEAMQRTVFNLLFSIQSIDVFVIVSAVVLSIWLIIWIVVLHKIAHFDSVPRFFFLEWLLSACIATKCSKLKIEDWRLKTEDRRLKSCSQLSFYHLFRSIFRYCFRN